MSSVSSFSPQTTAIDFMGPDKYRLTNQDADGDGVTDGKSLSGDSGKIVNEGELNQILAAHGLKATGGQFQSVDGFNVGSTNVGAVTSFGGPPSLPDVSGSSSPPATVGDRAGWLEVTEGLDDAALMWAALSTMAHTSMRDMKDAKQIKNAMQKAKLDTKKNQIEAAQTKIEAERKEAVNSFIWQVAGAVATLAISWASSDGGAVASGFSNASGAIGQAVSGFGTMQSKTGGAQHDADEAQLEEMRWQMMEQMHDMAIEDAKGGYEEAKELFKLALKIMSEHVERQSQVVQTITRG